MKYCVNCGEKIEDEDKFCTKCGFKQPTEDTNETSNSFNQYSQKFKENIRFQEIKNIFVKMLKCPISGAKEFVEIGCTNLVIAVTVILACIQGILGIWRTSQIFYNMEQVTKFNTSSKQFGGIFGGFNGIKDLMNISYGKIFFQNIILLAIIVLILFGGVLLFTNVIFKTKENSFKIYKIALIVIVPAMYFQIFSIIFSYISFYLGIGLIVVGIVASLMCFGIIIRDQLSLNDTKCVYLVSICGALIVIFTLICMGRFMISNIQSNLSSFTKSMW